MIKKVLGIIGVLMVLVVAMGIYYLVTLERIDENLYYGDIEPDVYDVYSTVPGIIQDVLVSEGEPIAEAQIVAKLVGEDAAVSIRKAALAKALADENVLKSISPVSEEEINVQKNRIIQLESQKMSLEETISGAQKSYKLSLLTSSALESTYEFQANIYNNVLSLYEAGVEPKSSLDSANMTMLNGQSAYESALLQSSKIVNDINGLKDQVIGIDSQIASVLEQLKKMTKGYEESDRKIVRIQAEMAELDAESAALVLNKYDVITYNSGVVESINYKKGEYINPGAPVLTIYDPESMLVKIYVMEKDIMKLSVGKEMMFRLAIDEATLLKGRVKRIATEAMFTPVNIVVAEDRERLVYEVEIQLNTNALARPGMLLVTDFNELE